MSGFFVLFLGNGFNYPGQQIAFRVIEIKKLNNCLFGIIQSFFRIQIFTHTNILDWRNEWLYHAKAILDASHMCALRMERMCLLIVCSCSGNICLTYLAVITSFNFDEIGYFFLVVNHLISFLKKKGGAGEIMTFIHGG